MSNIELQKRRTDYRIMCESESRVHEDMFEIACKYERKLNDIYDREGHLEMFREVFATFLYEKLPSYEQRRPVRDGVLLAIEQKIKDLSYELDNKSDAYTLEEEITNKVILYFDKFQLPKLDKSDARSILLHEVLNLDGTNIYRQRLLHTLLHALFNELDEVSTMLMVNNILADYDFNFKIPQENAEFKKERFRIKNYIPDFSNVKVGDTWSGGRRVAKFIRALKLPVTDAGKNTRTSQINSIHRSCEWIDDEVKKQLTLTQIYPERHEIEIKRPHKYEGYVETILLYLLQNKNETFTTTKRQFFKAIGAISKYYAAHSIYEYHTEEPLKDKVSYKELKTCHDLFDEIVSKRLNQILNPILGYLKKKGMLTVKKSIVIVVNTPEGKKYVPIDDSYKILKLKPIEAEEMIAQAQEAALSQIFVYDKKSRKNIPLTTLEEMKIHHKRKEFKTLYESYLENHYGWSYTYEELALSINEGFVFQPVSYEQCSKAQKELNELIVNAINTTITRKNTNLLEKSKKSTEEQMHKINSNLDTKELYETGVIDESDIKTETPYLYPDRFMDCVETFISKEISL